MRFDNAYSRQRSCTGQVPQIFFATSTPTPSLGKNTAGGWLLQFPSAIQSMALETYVGAIWFPSRAKRFKNLRLSPSVVDFRALCGHRRTAGVVGPSDIVTFMTTVEPEEEEQVPIAHATIMYLGPVAPHWELRVNYGDQKLLDDFWTRVSARLLLLPKHDPQFRRNRERVNRDAERELIICDWDLGEDDAETTATAPPPRAAEPAS